VPLSFAPTAEGNVSATLLLRSNAPDLSIGVTGAGTSAAVARPALSDATPFAFADTQVGQQSAAHSITLSNAGNAALKITSLVLGGSNPGDFALAGTCAMNGTVSPGANCSIDSSFKPSAAGARTADLLLMTDGGAQFTVRLSGNGMSVPSTTPSLSTAPQSFDFGSAIVGDTGPVKRFTLTNTGSAPLTINSATFSGPYAAASDANACAAFPLTLAAGASCELPVRFTPATTGNAAGSITLQATGASWNIALSGQGAASAPNTGGGMQNHGGGGCSSVKDGNDPMLAFLVVLAAGVLLWRRRRACRRCGSYAGCMRRAVAVIAANAGIRAGAGQARTGVCAERPGWRGQAGTVSREIGVHRFLGLVVRPVPPVLPMDERDAGALRQAGLADRRY
jgi:hypothetical protein